MEQPQIDWNKIILAIISLIGAIIPLWFNYKLKQEEKRKKEEQIERGEKPKLDVRTELKIKRLSILMYVCIIVLVAMLGWIVYDKIIPPPNGPNGETTGAFSTPTINLEIYTSPEYSSADNVCFYKVKANVTGNPTPTISFNKDDSSGVLGPDKAQVNLSDPSETYTLTATATNSKGSATTNIDLSWGCEIPPVEVVVNLVAEDSRSGYISESAGAFSSGTIVYFGDSDSNEEVKGYLSFNISAISNISDVTIKDADITITGVDYIGEPWLEIDKIRIKVFFYGGSLSPDDYAVGGELVKDFNTSNTLNNLSFSNNALKNSLQDAVDNGRPRFQLKIGLSGISPNSYRDVYRFESTNAKLYIEYEYNK